MTEHAVRTGARTTLQVLEDGPPDGLPVFTLHGTPGSRVVYPAFVADARARGIRLLSYDRPGYGRSTPVQNRRVGDSAEDVRAIADALGIDRFAVWGFSGGGAPALACAAKLPTRVVAAAVVAGVAPYPAEGWDWLAGTGEANVTDFQLMLNDRRAWEQKSRNDRDQMMAWTRETLRTEFLSLCSEVDRAALTDEVADYLLTAMKEGLQGGAEGMREDSLSTIRPWGFDLSTVRVPVQIWHGGQDLFVPSSHGRWVAQHLPRAETHFLPTEGHLSIWLRHVPDVHAWLRSKF